MARCEICLKSPQAGNTVSFSNRHVKRRWAPNVQRATILVDGDPKRVKICTRCLRSRYKTAART